MTWGLLVHNRASTPKMRSLEDVVRHGDTFAATVRRMNDDGLKLRHLQKPIEGSFVVTTEDPRLAQKWNMSDLSEIERHGFQLEIE